ncbi:MAG: hypothetical protein CL916_02455, partial [Deltaproteobacteria bacterium]|nr:hypothetical protein [Deltaproteobacteria bacterium]
SVKEAVSKDSSEEVEEIELDIFEEKEETKPSQEPLQEVEEVDLSFLDASNTVTTSDEEVILEDDIDISSLTDNPAEELVIISESEEHPKLTLQSDDVAQSMPERNEVIQSFLEANVNKVDIFSIQDDGFFTEEVPSKVEVETQEDEELAIPTASSGEEEEEIDLDFFEDLFDD